MEKGFYTYLNELYGDSGVSEQAIGFFNTSYARDIGPTGLLREAAHTFPIFFYQSVDPNILFFSHSAHLWAEK